MTDAATGDQKNAPAVPLADASMSATPLTPSPMPMEPDPVPMSSDHIAIGTEAPKTEPVAPSAPSAPSVVPAKTPDVPKPPAPPAPEPGSEAMPPTPPVPSLGGSTVTVPPAKPPRKKGSAKGIIGVIIVLLLTLPVAVYFISLRNPPIADIRSSAAGQVGYPCTWFMDCANGYECVNGSCQGNTNTGSCGRNLDIGAPVCCTRVCEGQKVCEPPNRLECKTDGVWCTIDANGCTEKTTQPPNTPIPPTGIPPVCQDIKVYKDGAVVTDLSTLNPGDAVTLAVKGNLTPDKAHFRVNGQQLPDNDSDSDPSWTETTAKNSAGFFTVDYTIPEGVADFVIEGEVYTQGAWH